MNTEEFMENTNSKDIFVKKKTIKYKYKYKFPIVGVGASAGGLAAFKTFFSGMPTDHKPNIAFVLVQHLAPDHKSILTEIIKQYTKMNVFEVSDGMVVKPNCTYIIPPNYNMAFSNGKLKLFKPEGLGKGRLPIDYLFRTLAQELQDKSICVVLSGSGSDGTMGVRAVKGECGMVIVQEPKSAEYDSMPINAINTGFVDYILPPNKIPKQIISCVNYNFDNTISSLPVTSNNDYLLKEILNLLHTHVGHDFSHYKKNTIHRRIERRMTFNQINNLNAYKNFLQKNALELDELFHDLLIGVTNFFRDSKVFEFLKVNIIPNIFEHKDKNTFIRVWIPGCSTGEEAYSIAILFREYMEIIGKRYKTQIFATDIDDNALNIARAGVYPANIEMDISKERLDKFFTKDISGKNYRIHKDIRNMLVFSEQNIIKDPPFSKLDLVSCRNLLIYMDDFLQKKIIPLFHYSLNTKGTLLLGTSETVGEFINLFDVIDRTKKVYIHKENLNVRFPLLGSFVPIITENKGNIVSKPKSTNEEKFSLQNLTESVLLDNYAPVGILVNERFEMLYVYGRAGMYLEPSTGEFEKSIIKMAREGLQKELAFSLRKAAVSKEIVHSTEIKVRTNGDFLKINVTVYPVNSSYKEAKKQNFFLVAFEKVDFEVQEENSLVENNKTVLNKEKTEESIITLSEKLSIVEEYLQSSIKERETSNEELKSSNEELQSVNEELQSTNEELETSKEELQSVNEELSTVNTELQTKLIDLSRINNDMNNLLAGTGIGTIFVNFNLHIHRFTPSITNVINLIKADIGRPVGHIVSNLVNYNNLVEDIQSVLRTLIPIEIDVQTKDGNWYSLRILPYRTIDNVIEGAVITFIDITKLKKIQETMDEMKINYEGTFKNSFDPIVIHEVILDTKSNPIDYIFTDANHAFEKFTGLSTIDIIGKKITQVYSKNEINTFMENYKKVMLNGETNNFTIKFEKHQKKFNVCAYKTGLRKLSVIFKI